MSIEEFLLANEFVKDKDDNTFSNGLCTISFHGNSMFSIIKIRFDKDSYDKKEGEEVSSKSNMDFFWMIGILEYYDLMYTKKYSRTFTEK